MYCFFKNTNKLIEKQIKSQFKYPLILLIPVLTSPAVKLQDYYRTFNNYTHNIIGFEFK